MEYFWINSSGMGGRKNEWTETNQVVSMETPQNA